MPIITHNNVIFIEIRRGKGLYGGDALVITESYTKNESYYYLYYAYEPYKLNMYKLPNKLIITSIEFDPKLALMYGIEKINKIRRELLTEGKCKLEPIEGEIYPNVVIKFKYNENPIRLKLYIHY